MPYPSRNRRLRTGSRLAEDKNEAAALHNQRKQYSHGLLCKGMDKKKAYRWRDSQTHTLDHNRCSCSAEQTSADSLLPADHYTNRLRRCISGVQCGIGILCVAVRLRYAIRTKQRVTNN